MFDVDKLIAMVCGIVILLFFVGAMVLMQTHPRLIPLIFLAGAGFCLAADVFTSNHPAAALRQPMRWIRSLYLSAIAVGAIYFGWNYFDEASDMVMVGLAILGLLIGEYVLKLKVFSLLSRLGDD